VFERIDSAAARVRVSTRRRAIANRALKIPLPPRPQKRKRGREDQPTWSTRPSFLGRQHSVQVRLSPPKVARPGFTGNAARFARLSASALRVPRVRVDLPTDFPTRFNADSDPSRTDLSISTSRAAIRNTSSVVHPALARGTCAAPANPNRKDTCKAGANRAGMVSEIDCRVTDEICALTVTYHNKNNDPPLFLIRQ